VAFSPVRIRNETSTLYGPRYPNRTFCGFLLGHAHCITGGQAMGSGVQTTLLDLLVELQAQGQLSEQALIALVLQLVNSGQVVLCGTYAGTRRLDGR